MQRSPFAIQDSISPMLAYLLRSIGSAYLNIKIDNSGHVSADAFKAISPQDFQFLDKHGLLMLCSEPPLDASMHTMLPPHLKQKYLAAISLAVAATHIQSQALVQALNTFDREGLTPAIVFKGSALGPMEYRHSWHRPKSDHDLLIPTKAKAAYHQSLLDGGFTHIISNTGRYVSYQASYVRKLSGSAHIWIDLHWKISNRQMLASLFDYTEIASHARPFLQSGGNNGELQNPQPALAPSRADCVILAAQHVIGHHGVDTRLLWFFDLLLVIRNCSDDELRQLVARCDELRVAGLVLAAINYAESSFSPILPNDVRQALDKLAKNAEPTQVLLRHHHSRLRLLWWDLLTIDNWKGRVSFVLENLFPNKTYMQVRFGSRWLLINYIKRFLGFTKTPNQL